MIRIYCDFCLLGLEQSGGGGGDDLSVSLSGGHLLGGADHYCGSVLSGHRGVGSELVILIPYSNLIYVYRFFCSPSSLWILLVIQGSKLLHLVGLPSKACFSVGAMLLTYSLPFIRHISEYLLNNATESDAVEAKKADTSTLHTAEVALYAVGATLATYWARSHIAFTVMRALLNNDELSDLQLNTACLAAWCFNMSCLLLVFVRRAKILRRYDTIYSTHYFHYL
jgi:hypothetical protein